MPRKRHYDLRDFWPWYERQWPTRYGFHATPPPFDLSDISRQKTTPTDKHIATATLVALPQRHGACRAYDDSDGVDDISAANQQIRPMVTVEGAVLVDLYPQFVPNTSTWLGLDGLHPNETGYAAMAQAFFDVIRARMER